MEINLTFWLIMALSASIIANFFAFWYIRRVLGRLLFISENISDLVSLITSYRKHLKSVYEMEQYYGDETIKYLLDHTRSLIELLESDYGDVYSMVEEIEIDPEAEEQQEESEYATPPQISEENVFYAGTRRSDN